MNSVIKKINESPVNFIKNTTVSKLEKILTHLSDSYYNEGKKLVSDEVFDYLKDKLEELDPNNKFLITVGAPVKKNKIKLPYLMPSLDKIKPDTNILNKWLNKYKGPYVVSDKLDGVSALYCNINNETKLYTRGNGTIGQDITHLLKIIKIKKIPNEHVIRGELIISKDDFKEIKNKFKMKNIRNTVSGIVNAKKYNKDIAKNITFMAYSLLQPKCTIKKQMKQLTKLNIDCVYNKTVNELSNDFLSKLLINRRTKSITDIDGIVVVDSGKHYKITKDKPKHAFAFKQVLTDQKAEVTVVDVIWNKSKDRYLKPKIKITPVNIGGAKITYATAFNAKFVKDNVIGIGAIVELIRSGDVIPHIKRIIKPSFDGKPLMPKESYIWNDTKVDIIATTMDNTNKVKLLRHFFKTLKIKYLDIGVLTLLVNNGIDTIAKIMTSTKEQFSQINGLGEKMHSKIIQEIKNVFENIDLATLMAGSNVFGRGFAVKRHKMILKEYPKILTTDFTDAELYNKIINIKGFEDKTAKQYVKNFKTFKKFFKTISKVYDLKHLIKKPKTNKNLTLDGHKYVFTGFRDKELETKIENLGGSVSTSISNKTTAIITNDINSKSSKLQKAKQLNVKIMTKDELIKSIKL